ncbi:MAG: ABC transporter substrate-binding protein [Cyanobacteria bacterium P01_G01_bin.19]
MNQHFVNFKTCALSLLLLLIACNPGNVKAEASVNNNDDQIINAQANISQVERVVTLTSLTSDIIHQLDPNKLVGISGSRLLAEDPRFQDLPTVSQGRTPPDLEKIVALEPDLVIGAEGFSDRTLNKLEELGIQTIATDVNSWQALEETTITLANAISADPQPLLERYQTFIPEELNTATSTLVLVSRQPILAPNKNSWAGDLLTKFQAKNLVADLQGNSEFGGYVTLSAEKVLTANPETILLVDPGREGIEEQLKAEPFWQELQATQSDRVYVFDYFGLVNPGSIAKIEESCQQLAKILSSE